MQIVAMDALVFFDRIEKRNGTPGLGNHGNVNWLRPAIAYYRRIL